MRHDRQLIGSGVAWACRPVTGMGGPWASVNQGGAYKYRCPAHNVQADGWVETQLVGSLISLEPVLFQ